MSTGQGIIILIITIVLALGLLVVAARSPGFKLGGVKSTYIPTSTYTPLPVKTTRKCVYCDGRGVVKCLMCNGRGGSYSEYYYDYLNKTTWKSCFFCDGTGVNTCSLCQGKGYR